MASDAIIFRQDAEGAGFVFISGTRGCAYEKVSSSSHSFFTRRETKEVNRLGSDFFSEKGEKVKISSSA